MLNVIAGINQSKTLTKHISCKCKCKFDGRKCNSDQWWNNDTCPCECKKHHICEIYYIQSYIYLLRLVAKMVNIVFLLITIPLLIVVNIYCYLIKHRAKQKHFFPFYGANNEVKEVLY